jgi:hypothetical protein
MSSIVPQSVTPLKRCTVCGLGKPATPEFFNRCARKKDGLKPQCKDCTRAQSREYQSRPEIKQRMRVYHQSWGPQYRARPDVAPLMKAYRDAYNAKYRSENRERLSADKKRRYRDDPAVRARTKATHYAWNHRPENRERLRARNHNRHARQKGAEGSFTEQDMRLQYQRQKGKCYWCHQAIAWDKRHDDHITPLNRGGSNWPDNLCVSCPRCNLSRHDKLPHEWPEGGRLL